MDTERGIKITFSNPNKPNPRPITPQLSPTDLITKKPADFESTSKTFVAVTKSSTNTTENYDSISITSSKDFIEQNWPNIPEEVENKKKENVKPKSIIDAHPETMATITCAMKSLACHAYGKTSEVAAAAVNVIHNEGVKHGILKNYPPGEDSVPKQVYDTISTVVESAVTKISNTANSTYETYKNQSFNDSSSKYDVPNKNSQNLQDKKSEKQKPCKRVSNERDTSSSKENLLNTIKGKITSVFTALEAPEEKSPNKTASSGITVHNLSSLEESELSEISASSNSDKEENVNAANMETYGQVFPFEDSMNEPISPDVSSVSDNDENDNVRTTFKNDLSSDESVKEEVSSETDNDGMSFTN